MYLCHGSWFAIVQLCHKKHILIQNIFENSGIHYIEVVLHIWNKTQGQTKKDIFQQVRSSNWFPLFYTVAAGTVHLKL